MATRCDGNRPPGGLLLRKAATCYPLLMVDPAPLIDDEDAAEAQALAAEREEMREQLILEVGCPRMLTYGPQLDAPLADGLVWPANFIDEFAWERDLPEGNAFGMRSWRKVTKEAVGVVGAAAGGWEAGLALGAGSGASAGSPPHGLRLRRPSSR